MVAARLAVLLGAAADELPARLAQPIQRKRWPRTVAPQAFQPCSILCGGAHPGVYRKPSVLVPQNLLGLDAFKQAPTHKSAQLEPKR